MPYLLIFPFTPVGLAALLGICTLIMGVLGRRDDIVTTGITTAVVMVVAAMSPQTAWQQPLLRLVNTVVGMPAWPAWIVRSIWRHSSAASFTSRSIRRSCKTKNTLSGLAHWQVVRPWNGQKLTTTFTPTASASLVALLPPGLMMYCRFGCRSNPGITAHPYVNSRVIS